MGPIESTLLRAKSGMVDPREAEAALERALTEERRLRRRRLFLAGASVGLFVAALIRITVVFCSPARAPFELAMLLDWSIMTIALAAATATLMLVRRIDARLDKLQQQTITLQFLLDVLEHESAPTVLVLEERKAPRAPEPVRVSAPEPSRPAPSMSAAMLAFIGVSVLALAWCETPASSSLDTHRWTFLEDTNLSGLGFTTPIERAGAWVLREHHAATGARALVNLAGTPGERPAIAVTDKTSLRDLQIVTRCMVSPELPEKACGLVFRYLNEQNYYVARIDAAGTVILGVVVDGVERSLQTAQAQVGSSIWQDLRVQARRDHVSVEWNGRRVIDIHDASIPRAGAIGLWAPANCVAYFDELEVRALASNPSQNHPFLL